MIYLSTSPRATQSRPSGLFRRLLMAVTVVVLLTAPLANTAAIAADKKSKPPPSKRTQVITKKVYEQLEAAQEAADADDNAKALAILDRLNSKSDKLNSYEDAMMWNFYASVYYGMEDIPRTLKAYGNVLKHKDIPEGLRNASLYAVAQLNMMQGNYKTALSTLDRWLASVPEPSTDALILKAQALYQLERYAEAERPIMQALGIARDKQQTPRENWLSLLLAVHFEQDEIKEAAKALELLVALYPKATYYRQLSGMYGLLERETDQIAVLRAAYEAGLLKNESEILNLARLYLANEAPYPAIKVMRSALDSGAVEDKPEALQLYAQALAFGQEYEAQIPILMRLAKKSGEGKHSVFLGQALSELERWEEAAEAYRTALKDEELDRPAMSWLSLGICLFNAGQLDEALTTFRKATEFEEIAEQASNWQRFVNNEKQRIAAVSAN